MTLDSCLGIEWNGRGPVVRRLRRGMDDDIGFHRCDQFQHPLTVADIQLVMREPGNLRRKALLVPARVALRAEEDRVDEPR